MSRDFSYLREFSANLNKSNKIYQHHFGIAMFKNIKMMNTRSKKESPVRTGALRKSITSQQSGAFKGKVYTDRRYAGFVHEGTSRHGANKFMTRAYQTTHQKMIKNFEKAQINSVKDFIK